MAHLYIIRGVPGSGKTTLANKMINCGMANDHFEADMFMVNTDGEYHFDRNRLGECHANCMSAVINSLASGRSVIVSNTFTRRWEYQNYQIMAQEFGIDCTIIVCQGNFKNIHGVPRQDVQRMRDRFEY